MYQVPVLFPQVSNRESWRQVIGIFDDDTGNPITLTDNNNNSLYTISLEITQTQPRGNAGGFLPGPFPYYSDCDFDPIITSISTIGTAQPAASSIISIVDVGTIQLFIPKATFSTLKGNRTYDVYMTVYEPDIDDGRQLFIGKIPVLYGGRNT